jgi:hypothetical protein
MHSVVACFPKIRERGRRRIMKHAQKDLSVGLENQKVECSSYHPHIQSLKDRLSSSQLTLKLTSNTIKLSFASDLYFLFIVLTFLVLSAFVCYGLPPSVLCSTNASFVSCCSHTPLYDPHSPNKICDLSQARWESTWRLRDPIWKPHPVPAVQGDDHRTLF